MVISAPAPSEGVLARLKSRYDEPQRHYHTWRHIRALLAHFDRHEACLHRPRAVLWALYWHDAIYDPRAPDNEERSAALLRVEAGDLLGESDLALAETIIIATAKHAVPPGLSEAEVEDLSFFLDIDLSILGARSDVFDAYELAIRREYGWVPEEAYRSARGAILTGFLGRDRIYFTPGCRDAWEVRARENLERSIEALSR